MADHLKVFGAGEMRIKLRLFRHIAKPLPVPDTVSLDGHAVKQNLAFGWVDQTLDHLKGRGFTGPVWAEVAGHLACTGDKSYVTDGRNS